MARPKTRPSIDDPGILAELCGRIATGLGIWKVCQSKDMPTRDDVYRRMAVDELFAAAIARAREAQQDALTDQISEISAKATNEDWQLARLRIWSIQWTAGKLAPRKYGDVKTHRVGGEGGGAIPLRFESLNDAQLAGFIERLDRFVTEREGDAGSGESGTGEEEAGS